MIVTGKEVVQWVARRTNEFGSFGTDIGIGLERRGELVAGVAYADWNGPNVVCHIAAEGKHWATRGYLWAIFTYPFEQLKCKRITVCVGDGNEDSKRFVKHLGFELEAVHEKAHPTGDLLTFRMWRQDCRYLREPYVTRPDLLRAAA